MSAPGRDQPGAVPSRQSTDELAPARQLERLREHKARLAALLRICTQLYRERDLDRLLERIASETPSILGCERATVFLADDDAGELWSTVATGVRGGIRVKRGQGLVGHAALTRALINVDDVYADARFNPEIDRRTGFRTRNLMAIALRDADDRVIGVFQALNKTDGPFTGDDEEILVALAGQAQVAIENARMLQQLEAGRQRLEGENSDLKRALQTRSRFDRIIGTAPALHALKQTAAKVADTPTSVLITGESGTGKTLLAQTLHYESGRASGPFVALNCAALPESLLESELFGIEQRVATGVDRRVGKIEAAHGGTLFLDEIGDMSPVTQSKLLQVLQERTLTRIGSHQSIAVDIRVLAATNKNLRARIGEGQFREDLYYRLNVVELHVPPLRERLADVPLLVRAILTSVCERLGKPPFAFAPEALDCLTRHGWPGNIRELENEIERAVSLADAGRPIPAEGLSPGLREAARRRPSPAVGGLPEAVAALERELIAAALEATSGNKKAAAAQLGISREGLRQKLIRYRMR